MIARRMAPSLALPPAANVARAATDTVERKKLYRARPKDSSDH